VRLNDCSFSPHASAAHGLRRAAVPAWGEGHGIAFCKTIPCKVGECSRPRQRHFDRRRRSANVLRGGTASGTLVDGQQWAGCSRRLAARSACTISIGRHRQNALAHRARLPGPQAGDRAWPQRRARLARFPSSRHLCIAAYGFLISERETIPPSAPRSSGMFAKPAISDGYQPRCAAAPAATPRP
jgi:hypothetical protein